MNRPVSLIIDLPWGIDTDTLILESLSDFEGLTTVKGTGTSYILALSSSSHAPSHLGS